jgi:hypothetical protein
VENAWVKGFKLYEFEYKIVMAQKILTVAIENIVFFRHFDSFEPFQSAFFKKTVLTLAAMLLKEQKLNIFLKYEKN